MFPGDQKTDALAPATGFVSTAADLAIYFGQLSPKAETSILTVASRREMSRPQWSDPWSSIVRSYGLGTIGGTFDGWDWFGHHGLFQGYVTRTVVIPGQDLSISCLANAADGMSHTWLDGVMGILKRFQDEGVPVPALTDWTGRWWSVFGAIDLVPMGEKVLLAAPETPNPFFKVAELTVIEPDEARISEAGAFASYGEPARLVRTDDGVVAQVLIGGFRTVTEAALAKEVNDRYQS